MKITRYVRLSAAVAFICFLAPVFVQAQTLSDDSDDAPVTVTLPPLFQYPVAPDSLDWTARSEWLAVHFWEPFDFRQTSVGQQQLNHAFATWCLPLRYAGADAGNAAVDALLKKLEKNPTLLLQFTRAAEHSIYSPESAQVWMDEPYLKFLRAVASSKKFPKTFKARYARQQKVLENSRIGGQVPSFEYIDRSGEKRQFNPSGKISIVEFGDPSCSDCQMARIALKSDDGIKALTDSSILEIYFIIPDADEEDTSWMEEVGDYPESWTVGAASGLDDILDLRVTPSLFLFDANGNLVAKNIGLNELRAALMQKEASPETTPDVTTPHEQ